MGTSALHEVIIAEIITKWIAASYNAGCILSNATCSECGKLINVRDLSFDEKRTTISKHLLNKCQT